MPYLGAQSDRTIFGSGNRAAAEQRVRQIYINAAQRAGVPVVFPPNLQALVDRAMGNPAYGQQIRIHAENDFRAAQGAPGAPATPAPTPQPPLPATSPAIDYREYAPSWLSGALLDTFVDHWSRTGDAGLAMAAVRRTPAYEQTFPGNRRTDGSLRYDEQSYLATRDAFSAISSEYGLGPLDATMIRGLFEREVSAQQWASGIHTSFVTFTEPGSAPPTQLMAAFAQQFASSGSIVQALQHVRESAAYDQVFAGNRRADGSLRMSEQDYYSYVRDWRRTLAGYGLNPGLFESRGDLLATLEGEMSIDEMAARMQATSEGIEGNIEQVRAFYATNYGIDLSREAILASAIDPTVESDLLARRISASQVGGEAALAGFARSLERAERLAAAGLGQTQARSLYAEASRRVPTLDTLARRHFDPRGEIGVGGFEDASVFGDAATRQRIQRRLADEASSFSAAGGIARDQQGALAGLAQR